MSEKTKVTNTVEISADKLMSTVLERSISDKDQTIGAQREHVSTLREDVRKLKDELKEAKEEVLIVADDQKIAIVSEQVKRSMRCADCEYVHSYSKSRNRCRNCGSDLPFERGDLEIIEYRNMDTTIENIRKEEAKKLKVDNVDLTEKLNNTEFELNKTVTELKKVESVQAEELTNAKRDVRERYQKEVATNEKKIEELAVEIQKLEENKTDEAVEEARKQEIIDLKEQITELTETIEEAKKIPRLKKYFQRVAARSEARKLKADKDAKEKRVEEISNNYPKAATESKNRWWTEGKYAKANINEKINMKEDAEISNWVRSHNTHYTDLSCFKPF